VGVALRAAVASEQETARQVVLYGFFDRKEDLHRAYCAHPDNGNVRFFMAREFADSRPDHRTFCVELSAKEYRTGVARHPTDPLALIALAENDLLDEALPRRRGRSPSPPRTARAWTRIGAD
jgi:hypothetical protein